MNQVGGQDELVFDGYSMIMDKNGKLIYLADGYTEDIRIIDMGADHEDLSEKLIAISNEKYGRIYDTLVLGLQDYLAKTGIKDVTIGVS